MANQTTQELSVLLNTKNTELSVFEKEIANTENEYKHFSDILNAHKLALNTLNDKEKELDKKLVEINELVKITNDCDKWDYIFASSAGVLAGLVDSFFVGSPTDSKWLKSSDNVMNTLVEKFAKANGWNGPKEGSNSLRSAISYLERTFGVDYDHRHTADVGGLFTMSASNHHLKSLAHSPSPVGLIFSIIDQFTSTASFYDNGNLIRITVENGKHTLQGSNFISKLFSAFVNWLGHIMSDIAGSNGAASKGNRGAGVPIPFYELLQGLNFGSFGEENQTLAEIAVKVFEQGYDFRFGMVQTIPVLMVELFIRIFSIIRHRFQYNRPWSECLDFLKMDKSPKLQKMLLAGQGTLCLIDASDAFIRSGFAQNWVEFFSRLNFVAWMRFSYLGLRRAVSILNNDIELMRYKLRKEAFDNYLDDVTTFTDTFLAEHNKKVEKYFLDRRKEFDELFNKLEISLKNENYDEGYTALQKIGNKYGLESKFSSLDEMDDYIMSFYDK